MAYLTERKLSNTLDLPINLPATEVKMGDWLVISTFKLTAPMRLTYRMLHLNLVSSTFDITKLTSSNLIVPTFGLCYVGLFTNYISGDPSTLAAADAVAATNLGVAVRNSNPVVTNVDGTYSWIMVNNVQFSDQNPLLSALDSADFTVCVTGQARIELDLVQ